MKFDVEIYTRRGLASRRASWSWNNFPHSGVIVLDGFVVRWTAVVHTIRYKSPEALTWKWIIFYDEDFIFKLLLLDTRTRWVLDVFSFVFDAVWVLYTM